MKIKRKISSHISTYLLFLAVAASVPLIASAQTKYFVVTTSADDAGVASHCTAQGSAGSGSDAACGLRDALAQAALSSSGVVNVSFDGTVFSLSNAAAANTITLSAGSLQVPANTSVVGPVASSTAGIGLSAAAGASNVVTVSGNHAATVFTIASGAANVKLANLNIVEGSAVEGGGIVNAGSLALANCTVSGNAAASAASGVTAGGGGILNSGTLTVNGSTIAANTATADAGVAEGGGILNSGTLSIVSSTVAGNSATAAGTATGGGIFTTNAPGSSLGVVASTVSANTADGAGGGIFSNRPSTTAVSAPLSRTLQTLGDSITFGYASTGCPAPYTPVASLANSTCWTGMVAYNLGYSLYDIGVSSASVGDVSLIEIYDGPRVEGSNFGQFISGPNTVATFLIGANDNGLVPGETIDYFNGTRMATEWQMEHEDVTAFMLTPNKHAANASPCTASAGWTPSTLWAAGGLETTTSGTTISCPIIGSTAYVSVMAQVGNASSILISIDGGPATAYTYAHSGPTSKLLNTASGQLFRIPNLQPASPGTPAATAPHTVTITANVSAGSPVFVNWVDGNGNEAGSGPVVFALSSYQTALRTDASGSLPRFRSFLAQEAADLRADGLNEIVGDLSIPCTQVPVSDPPVSLCDTFDGTHPTDSGEALIAPYVEQLIQNSIAFSNSVVAGNTAPLAADTNDLYIDKGGNQVGSQAGSDVAVSAIGLAPLASYGGPTQTMPPLPASPALCAGISANLTGITTDQRGLPRSASYATGSGAVTCIDAGAVQTHYALAFAAQPPVTANLEIPIAPTPQVVLTESGAPATAATSTVSITDSLGLLTGTTQADLSAGMADFNDLVIPTATAATVLTATLPLTPAINLTTQSTSFKVTQAVIAAMSAPAPGSVLGGASVTFNWSATAGATGYFLEIGSTGAGSNNIYNSSEKTVTTYTLSAMPTNGEAIYVRLITNFNGTWLSNDYVYTAASPATMTSPTSGAVFIGSSVTFSWAAKPSATGYYIWIGDQGAGSNDIYNSAEKTATTYTFANMPTNGQTVYVRLITNYQGSWAFKDYVYTEAKQAAALLTPVPGSTLTGASETFTWSAPAGVTGYYLWIGTTGVGSNDLYNSEEKTVTSYNFTRMPTNGATVYVRLNTNYNGAWVEKDYVFTAAMLATPMSLPAAASTFGGPSVPFSWPAAPGASGYYLWIGSTGVGSSDLYKSQEKTVTTYTFTGMPTNGETIYVRLSTAYLGTWVFKDYTYSAASQAVMKSPAAGSTLPGASVTFTWSAAAGATGYYLWIGTTGPGSNNIYNSAEKTVTSYIFSGMPTNAQPVYVRLNTNYGGTWRSVDYTYTEAQQPAVMTSPSPGARFSSASVAFAWTAAPNATGYYLWIGSTGVGSNDIYNSQEKTGTTYTFTRMPTNGETTYVRLNTNFNGVWVSKDYLYTAAAPAASMASPAASGTFAGKSVSFSWSAAPSATDYYLQIGTTGVGSKDLYNSAPKTTTAYTFYGMPTNGETIYVRLVTNYNGLWVYRDYTYIAGE